METQKNKNGKKGIVLLLVVAIMAFIYFFTGFFVVQPIGAIPEEHLSKLTPGRTYKLKMAYIPRQDNLELGYFSTTGIIKSIY